jgi:hypothetical protein
MALAHRSRQAVDGRPTSRYALRINHELPRPALLRVEEHRAITGLDNCISPRRSAPLPRPKLTAARHEQGQQTHSPVSHVHPSL